MTEKKDSCYPYTYAADHIRMLAGYTNGNERGTKLSRSDASRIRQEIADIIGMNDEELAKKIADKYMIAENCISEEILKEILLGD